MSQERPVPLETDVEVARRRTMRAARKADQRGDKTTHHRLLLAADALDDAAESASGYDFKRTMQAEELDERSIDSRLHPVPTPWKRR